MGAELLGAVINAGVGREEQGGGLVDLHHSGALGSDFTLCLRPE